MKISFQSVSMMVVAVLLLVGAGLLYAFEKLAWEQAQALVALAIGLIAPGAFAFGPTKTTSEERAR